MSDKRYPNNEDVPDDLETLLNRSAEHLRAAAKACRVKKGGPSCDALSVVAEVVAMLGPVLAPNESTSERDEAQGSEARPAETSKKSAGRPPAPAASKVGAQPATTDKTASPTSPGVAGQEDSDDR